MTMLVLSPFASPSAPWENLSPVKGVYHVTSPAGYFWLSGLTKLSREIIDTLRKEWGSPASFCGYTKMWHFPERSEKHDELFRLARLMASARPMPKSWMAEASKLAIGDPGRTMRCEAEHYVCRTPDQVDANAMLLRTGWGRDDRMHIEQYPDRFEVWARHNTLHRQIRACLRGHGFAVDGRVASEFAGLAPIRVGVMDYASGVLPECAVRPRP